MTAPLQGRVVHMGDLTIDGETIPGVLVEIPRETLAAMKESPLYREVTIAISEIKERKWCAWCGVWGDHQSGGCLDLKRAIKEKEQR